MKIRILDYPFDNMMFNEEERTTAKREMICLASTSGGASAY